MTVNNQDLPENPHSHSHSISNNNTESDNPLPINTRKSQSNAHEKSKEVNLNNIDNKNKESVREENFEKKDEEDDVVMNEGKEPLRGIDFPKGIIIEDVQDKKLCEEPEHYLNSCKTLSKRTDNNNSRENKQKDKLLIVATINIRNITNKIGIVKKFLFINKIDILNIQEMWINDENVNT